MALHISKLIQPVCLAFTVISLSPLFAMQADFYSEQSYLGRQSMGTAMARAKVSTDLAEVWTPFFQGGFETRANLTENNAVSDPMSTHLFIGPGLKRNLGPISLLGEIRYRNFIQNSPVSTAVLSPIDARFLLMTGTTNELGRLYRAIDIFLESYGEGVFSSADSNNVTFSTFFRLGVRHQIEKEWTLDSFLEPFIAVDTLRHFYNNRADLKPSLRIKYTNASFSLSLTGSYVFNTYFSRGDLENNPFRNNNSGFQFIAILGGSV